jgi:hypothetical protein
MASTPHSWDDIVVFLQQSEAAQSAYGGQSTRFHFKLVDHIQRNGYFELLSPMMSVGRLFIFPRDDANDKCVMADRPIDGLVQIELLRGHGDEASVIRMERVPEDDAVAVAAAFIKNLLPRSQGDSKDVSSP